MSFRSQPLHAHEARYLVWLDLFIYAPSKYMPTQLYSSIRLLKMCRTLGGYERTSLGIMMTPTRNSTASAIFFLVHRMWE